MERSFSLPPTHLLKRKRRKDPYWPPSASLSQPDNNNNPTTKKRNFPSADPFKFLFRPHSGTKKLLLFREINISGGESLIILPASACNYSRPKYHPLRPNSRKRVEKMKLVKFATTTPPHPPISPPAPGHTLADGRDLFSLTISFLFSLYPKLTNENSHGKEVLAVVRNYFFFPIFTSSEPRLAHK